MPKFDKLNPEEGKVSLGVREAQITELELTVSQLEAEKVVLVVGCRVEWVKCDD